jgi:D-sedoheptulose 7-phosphate isomerase
VESKLGQALAIHADAMAATVAQCAPTVAAMVEGLCSCFNGDGKLLLCGNGGSAADSQHIAGEFVNKLTMIRRPLPALALSTDTSVLTCIANDACYDDVFARQVEALGRRGDILVALSTSGRSANIVKALTAARSAGLVTWGFTGESGAPLLQPHCDLLLAVASTDCATIQEGHEFLWHFIAGSVERSLFGRRDGSARKGA